MTNRLDIDDADILAVLASTNNRASTSVIRSEVARNTRSASDLPPLKTASVLTILKRLERDGKVKRAQTNNLAEYSWRLA